MVSGQVAGAKVISLPVQSQHATRPAFAFLGIKDQVLAADFVFTF